VKQALKVTAMNLRSIPGRLGNSLVICIGTASVVAVLVTVLGMSSGLMNTMVSGLNTDRVLVMRKGALAETLSSLSRDAVLAVETAPGIQTVGGRPAVSPEVVVSVDLPRRDGTGRSAVFVRGLTDAGWLVRPDLEPVNGRRFEPGRFEVIVGRSLGHELSGLEIGDELTFYSNRWTVVGVFDTGGAVSESQLITDAATLMAVAQRNVYSGVAALVVNPEAGEALKEALEGDPRLVVDVVGELDYYQRQGESASRILQFIAYIISAIMALGALFGAVNTMYTAVAARTAEIAILRALGFGGGSVVFSVVAEAVILSLIGALIGAIASWLLFNGMHFNAGGQLGTIGVELVLGAPTIVVGVLWALIIGILAGLFPALRAARLPVAVGLRIGG